MSNNPYEGSDNPCERAHGRRQGVTQGATVAAYLLAAMQGAVREAAFPAQPGESVKAAIGRAARRLGLPYSRARQHWYGQARSVPAEEWIAAQEAALRLRRERAAWLREQMAALGDVHETAAAGDLRGPAGDRGCGA